MKATATLQQHHSTKIMDCLLLCTFTAWTGSSTFCFQKFTLLGTFTPYRNAK